MRSSSRNLSDQTIQELLNEELQAEAELSQMNQNIQALQNKVIGKDWWDGNFIIKWSRYLNQEKDHDLHLHAKDRVFSISSVTSNPSAELVRIENKLLDNNPIHSKNQARKKFQNKIKKDKNHQKQQIKPNLQPTPKKRRRIKRRNKKLNNPNQKINQKSIKINSTNQLNS